MSFRTKRDEEHRQPIQRPSLTVVIDVYSRIVLGFAIYLEKPSAFTAALAIAVILAGAADHCASKLLRVVAVNCAHLPPAGPLGLHTDTGEPVLLGQDRM